MLAGKLAAQVVADRATGNAPAVPAKAVRPEIASAAAAHVARDPIGLGNGDSPVVFGGGTQFDIRAKEQLVAQDPVQLEPAKEELVH